MIVPRLRPFHSYDVISFAVLTYNLQQAFTIFSHVSNIFNIKVTSITIIFYLETHVRNFDDENVFKQVIYSRIHRKVSMKSSIEVILSTKII